MKAPKLFIAILMVNQTYSFQSKYLSKKFHEIIIEELSTIFNKCK